MKDVRIIRAADLQLGEQHEATDLDSDRFVGLILEELQSRAIVADRVEVLDLIEERIGRRRWILEESDVVRVARIDYGGVGAILNERWLGTSRTPSTGAGASGGLFGSPSSTTGFCLSWTRIEQIPLLRVLGGIVLRYRRRYPGGGVIVAKILRLGARPARLRRSRRRGFDGCGERVSNSRVLGVR
jgi:hypothetical protein